MSNSGAPCVNPVVVVAQEFTVISVHSSDTDSSDEGRLSDSQSESVSPIQTNVSGQVVESPSHYPAPDKPAELSAVSSVLISPNRVREDCLSVSLDLYPVYVVSLDTTGYVPPTAVSLPPSDPESLPPVTMDGVLACDLNLLDREPDLSLLNIPLLTLPAGMLLVPVLPSDQPSASPESPSWREQRARAVSPSGDLSQEGPFDAYCAPLDTGDHPLVSNGLPVAPIV